MTRATRGASGSSRVVCGAWFIVTARAFQTRGGQPMRVFAGIFSLAHLRKIIDDIFLRLYSASLKGGKDAMAKKKAATKKSTTKKTTKKKGK